MSKVSKIEGMRIVCKMERYFTGQPYFRVRIDLPNGERYGLDKVALYPEIESYFDGMWRQMGEDIKRILKKEEE